MVFAHLAGGGAAYIITHAPVWVNGAMGFVLLSGLVVGMVQRRLTDKKGLRAGQAKLLRRAWIVYLGHLFLCALSFAVVAYNPAMSDVFASIDSEGGILPAALAMVTLQVNPIRASILSLYVLLLLFTVGAVWLLRNGQWRAVLGISAVVAVAGYLFPDAFTFARGGGVAGEINWANWQALYMSALVLGWNWSSRKVHAFLDSKATFYAGLVIVGILTVAANAFTRMDLLAGTPIAEAVLWLFATGNLGIGTLFMSYAAFAVLYVVCRRVVASPRLAGWAEPLNLLGRKSLDSYILLSIMTISVPAVISFNEKHLGANLYAMGGLVLLYAWARFRDRKRRADAPESTPAAQR